MPRITKHLTSEISNSIVLPFSRTLYWQALSTELILYFPVIFPTSKNTILSQIRGMKRDDLESMAQRDKEAARPITPSLIRIPQEPDLFQKYGHMVNY